MLLLTLATADNEENDSTYSNGFNITQHTRCECDPIGKPNRETAKAATTHTRKKSESTKHKHLSVMSESNGIQTIRTWVRTKCRTLAANRDAFSMCVFRFACTSLCVPVCARGGSFRFCSTLFARNKKITKKFTETVDKYLLAEMFFATSIEIFGVCIFRSGCVRVQSIAGSSPVASFHRGN